MPHEMDDTSGPFLRLLEASAAIKTAIRGKDILVLENDDEMLGYLETPIEREFCQAAEPVMKALQAGIRMEGELHPQNLALIIESLVNAHLGAEAYRSRMFKYATDWGSEISPVANASRRILTGLRAVLHQISREDRKEIQGYLSKPVAKAVFTSFYWTEWDRHGSEIVGVAELLGNDANRQS